MTFTSRYGKLNPQQRKAVDQIDGPVLVIAGPGTGKTELLSMRVANILQKTDTLPESILCLTFTDSGAVAMRERLTQIIGPAAYKVAIHTFHSFGTETIGQNREYFFRGSQYRPADDIATHEILTKIFDSLSHENPLSSKNNDQYVYMSEVKTAISELKKSGLTSDELIKIIDDNNSILDNVEAQLADIFDTRVSKTTGSLMMPIAESVARLSVSQLPAGFAPLSSILALSMAHAFDDAVETNSTKPITAWRSKWMERNDDKKLVFRDRKRHGRLQALAHIYYSYIAELDLAALFDYDDMILQLVHGLETQNDLRYNLQEKYQYILIDEFQDTNLAQLRILFNLTDSSVNEGQPNIMAVGDDDQAIYSFQGADVSNINRFIERFPETKLIPLKDNYRSTAVVIGHAREVIIQGEDRLEHQIAWLDKDLTAHRTSDTLVSLTELSTPSHERQHVAESIAKSIGSGTKPAEIAIIARRHRDLEALVPFLEKKNIPISYERRDNVLDSPPVKAVELIARVVIALQRSEHDIVNSLMPELVSHLSLGFEAVDIWKLSLKAYELRTRWIDIMIASSTFKPLADWLIDLSQKVPHTSCEEMLDTIVGSDESPAISQLYQYYFSSDQLTNQANTYLAYLEALRSIRSKLREYQPDRALTLIDFIEFIELHRQIGSQITSSHQIGSDGDDAVRLLTSHKSKGLEFDEVYILDATDSAWGQKARSKNRLISYPENMPLAPAGDSYDERIRLFFVAMTRAKSHLHISYSAKSDNGKDQLPASFLAGTTLSEPSRPDAKTGDQLAEQLTAEWHDSVLKVAPNDIKKLLASSLENYKLSVTHLTNFLDVTSGGPQHFLTNNLLHFPSAKSSNAGYGTAIHSTLQKAHDFLVATDERRPVEDIYGDFESFLRSERLVENEHEKYLRRGIAALGSFLGQEYASFNVKQRTELDFRSQGVIVNEAHLAGKLDLVEIDKKAKTISVLDYKTGNASVSTKGKDDREKIKLHKYKQQLMFYRLLCENSRDYSSYDITSLKLQFVEPTPSGKIVFLEFDITETDIAEFKQLIGAVWQNIKTLDLPDVSEYEQNYKGILAFEQSLLDKS
ncbi:MAG: ATP-dependent DNA helicase [Candidatus Saccharimonadaceae bacterium]